MAATGLSRYGVLMLMLCVPGVDAQTGAIGGQLTRYAEISASPEPIVAEAEPKQEPEKRKAKSSALFWIVLVISLLFVVGSASALNALGGKHTVPRKQNKGGGSGQGSAGDDR